MKIRIEVVYVRTSGVDRRELEIDDGAAVKAVIEASHVLEHEPPAEIDRIAIGISGRRVSIDHPVRDGDRIELYSPLAIDPMEARRERARREPRKRRRPRP